MPKPIPVTKPALPPLEELLPYLERIWESKIITNGGPFHQQLESELADFLGVEHISLFNNGTAALITAIQALRLSGEVITTPFSFVATSHALWWNNIKPIFVDIDPQTLNLDPRKIEAAITPHTTAILPVHCYGTPCETMEIAAIADNYNLKVLYDAAHTFGVRCGQESLLAAGDMSILSFHATKVFNTLEGGAIISPDAKTKQRVDRLKNFGIVDEITVAAPGTNGKMNEVCAALGLLQLKHIKKFIARRRVIDESYREQLAGLPGITCIGRPEGICHNYAYFPILVEQEYPLSRDELYFHLKEHDIHPRRYFYPLISDYPMYRGLPSVAKSGNLPVATKAAERVLCLPIYPELSDQDVSMISEKIRRATPGKKPLA